ncbi:MAG: site-2 protease family protein [Haloarculaceae archaeon]
MVNTLALVLAGVLLYTVVAMVLRARGSLPPSVRIQGPITTIHTQRGRAFLDWLARPKRFWRAWGNFGVGIALVVMVGSFVAVLAAAYGTIQSPQQTAITQPQNVLVIPGVNDFLPLSAAPEIVFGLLVGLVVHEGGHGLLCRVGDIEIDSMGLALVALVPVGAFVEPDEDSRQRADRGNQTRMFAAGVTNNFAVALVAFLLLFGPVVGAIQPVAGAAVGDVARGSAAAAGGIQRGDVITGVNGTAVTGPDDLDAALREAPGRTLHVSLADGREVTVQRRLLLTRAVESQVPGIDLSGGPPVVSAVNGTPVHTQGEFLAQLGDRSRAQVQTESSGNATIVAGALVAVAPDEPLAAAGATPGTSMVITQLDGDRVVTDDDLTAALSDTDPGQTVTVVAYRDGERRTYQVELGTNQAAPDRGLLGVRVQAGVSGITVDDFGADVYPADQYLALLGGGDGPFGLGAGNFFQRVFLVLFLPFASAVDPTFTYNFAGFVGPVTNFYEPTGPLAVLGGGVFTLANVLFWTGWVNLQLGFFNCIPAFPLDGGHILRTSTEAVVSRLPIRAGRSVTSVVTTAISLVMLAGVLLMVFGAQLLG